MQNPEDWENEGPGAADTRALSFKSCFLPLPALSLSLPGLGVVRCAIAIDQPQAEPLGPCNFPLRVDI